METYTAFLGILAYTTRPPRTSCERTSPYTEYVKLHASFFVEWRQRPSALVEKSEKLLRKAMNFGRQIYAILQPYDDFICSSYFETKHWQSKVIKNPGVSQF